MGPGPGSMPAESGPAGSARPPLDLDEFTWTWRLDIDAAGRKCFGRPQPRSVTFGVAEDGRVYLIAEDHGAVAVIPMHWNAVAALVIAGTEAASEGNIRTSNERATE